MMTKYGLWFSTVRLQEIEPGRARAVWLFCVAGHGLVTVWDPEESRVKSSGSGKFIYDCLSPDLAYLASIVDNSDCYAF